MSDPKEQEIKSLLDQATDKLDLATLQNVFKDMCAASEECQKQAAQRLLTGSAKRAADNGPDDAPPEKKAKSEDTTFRPRYELCQSCKKSFDITKNCKTACRYHEGNLELNEEEFPDDDQVMYDPGSIDVETDWRREGFHDGFIYDCCGKNWKAEGCCIDRHMTAQESAEYGTQHYIKRPYEVEDGTGDEEDSEAESEDEY